MFYKHLLVNDESGTSLYLYIDFNYEFAKDFESSGKKERGKTMIGKITKYMEDKKINFKVGKVFLVVGGLVIGYLFINNQNYSDLTDSFEPKYNYVEEINVFDNNNNNENGVTAPIQDNESKKEDSSVSKENQQPSTKNETSNVLPKEEKKASAKENTKPSTPVQETINKEPAPINETERKITLYRYNGIIEQIPIEQYVIGVVAAEMPASFEIEALKAQSVLARTYALKKTDEGIVLNDNVSHQVYKDNQQLKQLWRNNFEKYYKKIEAAVKETKDETIRYNDNYIEAVYHSTSNGRTEDSITVWNNSYPYLKSVDSHWDLDASSYLKTTEKEFDILKSLIGIDFTNETNIKILSRTAGNRVKEVMIDNVVFSGIKLREMLGLRSADFEIEIKDGKAVFITRGFGHGVGMSQYGANGMAKEGYTYKEILKHYYPGTQIKKGD
ncbi:MAG TPA: stage II sporulation protein D [Mollicutes bacterium]|nr:stage II sporulation protein D [Mollicutes bacterium]